MSYDPTSPKPRLKSPLDWLRVYLSGVAMGAADMIPGVSGGTLAWMTGIYEDMLHSIQSLDFRAARTLFSGRIRAFFDHIAWEFLLALLLGIGTAFVGLAHFFRYCLGHEAYRELLYALFFGLILASIVYCAKLIKQWQLQHIAALIAGIGIAWSLTSQDVRAPTGGFEVPFSRAEVNEYAGNVPLDNYDYERQVFVSVPEVTVAAMVAKQVITPETVITAQISGFQGPAHAMVGRPPNWLLDPWAILCGAIAISAMLLPGISGAYLLTILGMYAAAIGALADFTSGLKLMHIDWEAFGLLASLAIGIVSGAAVFSRVITWLFDHYRQSAIALLTGFMVGAMRVVWPFWQYHRFIDPLKPHKGPQLLPLEPLLPEIWSSHVGTALAISVIGFMSVFVLEAIAHRHDLATN